MSSSKGTTSVDNLDGITNLAEAALKIKDEANQLFNGPLTLSKFLKYLKMNFLLSLILLDYFLI